MPCCCKVENHLDSTQKGVPTVSQAKKEAEEIGGIERGLQQLEIREKTEEGANPVGKGEHKKKEEGEGQKHVGVKRKKEENMEELVELIQEDPWMGEWKNFEFLVNTQRGNGKDRSTESCLLGQD